MSNKPRPHAISLSLSLIHLEFSSIPLDVLVQSFFLPHNLYCLGGRKSTHSSLSSPCSAFHSRSTTAATSNGSLIAPVALDHCLSCLLQAIQYEFELNIKLNTAPRDRVTSISTKITLYLFLHEPSIHPSIRSVFPHVNKLRYRPLLLWHSILPRHSISLHFLSLVNFAELHLSLSLFIHPFNSPSFLLSHQIQIQPYSPSQKVISHFPNRTNRTSPSPSLSPASPSQPVRQPVKPYPSVCVNL